jgi:plastocyanin
MRNLLWIIVAIIIVGGGYWLWSSSQDSATNTNITVDEGAASDAPGASGTVLEGSGDVTDAGVGGDTAVPNSVEVTYDGSSFSPKDVTVKKGGTVTWKNAGTGKMWVASAQHPTHTVYSGTSRSEHCATSYTGAKPFDQCVGDGDYSFTFDKVGKHGYHDHINASAFGSVTVVE